MTPVDGGFTVLGGHQPGQRGLAFKLSVGLGIVAALAILAGTAGLAVTASAGHKKPAKSQVRTKRSIGPAGPMRVESIMPPPGTVRLTGGTTIVIRFSAPVAGSSAYPTLSPDVPGHWQPAGRTLTFTPDNPLPPSTRFRLRIPAGETGVESAAGGLLAKPRTVGFRTDAYSHLRLAELLSMLGYLPLIWTPGDSGRMWSDPGNLWPGSQEEMAYSPPLGNFIWRPGYPRELRSQWQPYKPNPLVRGAVMAFKAQHHMPITPATGQKFWRKLFFAAEHGDANPAGYTYAVARKGSPETLTIWHNGHLVLRSLANTGIPIRPTVSGTFPVYLRLRHQVMQGTNPDGSHYADPVSFVAYFNGGDAVHYFPRGSYGSEQSLGCVELPYTNAARAWPYLTYGSLVTVVS
ncbi:MAG: Ig-like domain-containing protein [Nocardiopsaceae bacterium]|nr:Ig-like domain-containing protein [Nocardiopsaceae bacterium]